MKKTAMVCAIVAAAGAPCQTSLSNKQRDELNNKVARWAKAVGLEFRTDKSVVEVRTGVGSSIIVGDGKVVALLSLDGTLMSLSTVPVPTDPPSGEWKPISKDTATRKAKAYIVTLWGIQHPTFYKVVFDPPASKWHFPSNLVTVSFWDKQPNGKFRFCHVSMVGDSGKFRSASSGLVDRMPPH